MARSVRIGLGETADKETVVRLSVDLARDQHEFLKQFAFAAQMTQAAVGRALVGLIRDDRELAERVLALIRQRSASEA
jgi:phosphate uptake regulator